MNLGYICGTDYEQSDSSGIIRKLREFGEYKLGKVFVFCRGKIDISKRKCFLENGANKVIVCDSNKKTFIEMCREWIEKNQIGLIVFSDSMDNKEMASILAIMLDGGLTADCIDIEYTKDNQFIFSRAALSDTVIVKIVCKNTRYQMCTVKRNSFFYEDGKTYTDGTIEYIEPIEHIEEQRVEILGRKNKATKFESIAMANKVFGFGRGIGSYENMEKLKVLAKYCSAEVGGTRAVVEEGMIDETHQIGQSGICISPEVYVAFGISGASQHIVGIKNAKVVININKDKSAPIMDYSDYVFIEDSSNLINNMLKILNIENKK